MAGRRSDEHARATRARILREALELASHVGFDGITIGGLAKQLDMSKAGVLGHFASKEELQLAVHAEAAAIFKREVVDRGRDHPPGIQRLLAFCSRWADFIEAPPWSGGCILTAASFEFDAQSGPVAERTRQGMVSWRTAIQRQAQVAIDDGDLPRERDAAQVAFVIVAMVTGTIQAIQTHRDSTACDRLRTALAVQFGRPVGRSAAAHAP